MTFYIPRRLRDWEHAEEYFPECSAAWDRDVSAEEQTRLDYLRVDPDLGLVAVGRSCVVFGICDSRYWWTGNGKERGRWLTDVERQEARTR